MSPRRCWRTRSRSSPLVRIGAVERGLHPLARGLGVGGGELGVEVVGRRVGLGDPPGSARVA